MVGIDLNELEILEMKIEGMNIEQIDKPNYIKEYLE